MTRVLLTAITACALTLPASAQQAPPAGAPLALSQRLGIDPAIITGTLPNGIRYYIRKNIEPAKRAELRLVVNAGSVLEDDDQLGYAHFLEHTAFNGTRNFKKNDLVKYLQSIGVQFGADLNAYTSFDETVYQLSVPTDTARLVEQAFLILEDWAHGQLFDSTEVVNERGVVLEEWRGRLGAGERMMREAIPVILKGSKYADRLPIGTQESIQRAQPSTLRRFYADWYRPDLMAVVAVGDFDVATIEGLIKKHFTGIAPRANPRPRPVPDVPGNTTPLISITTDPEATSSNVSLDIKHAIKDMVTVGDYRRSVAEQLYFSMINARLREIALKADPPFLGASVSSGGFIGRTIGSLSFSAGVKDGGIVRGLEAVLVEARRAEQFGFLDAELRRAKENVQRSYERAFDERAKTHSASLVGELVGHYLENEAIPGIEFEYQLVRQVLPTITLDEVNSLVRDWITDENRVISASAPQKAGLATPTQAELLAAIDRASKSTVVAYTEAVGEEPLIERLPARGSIVATNTNAAVNLTEWKLSNGARVLVKPTDFRQDQILFSAYSPGGTSLVSDADFRTAAAASAIVGSSGLGKYNSTDLAKKLAGKAAGASAGIGSLTETLSGNASPKDLETMFQLIHLRFTAPRLDTAAWQALKAGAEAQLANAGAAPQQVFADTVGVTMTQYHPRTLPMTLKSLEEINPDRALAIYKDRFANAGDFTFLFVGTVNLDSLKPLVETYIASLPNTGRVENWRDIGIRTPDTVVTKTVRKGTEPQAVTYISFTGPAEHSAQARFEMLALSTLGQMWITDKLREELGGTYSPQLNGVLSRVPRPEYSITVSYPSAPDNVDKLSASVMSLVDSLRNVPATDADLTKVREQIIRARETSIRTNAYWLGNIGARDQAGEPVEGLLGAYDEMVKNLTAKQIQDAAQRYFNKNRYVKVVLLPERRIQ